MKVVILGTGSTLSEAIAIYIKAASISEVSFTSPIYDMKPKNAFRGGSRGKGGKIKYARR